MRKLPGGKTTERHGDSFHCCSKHEYHLFPRLGAARPYFICTQRPLCVFPFNLQVTRRKDTSAFSPSLVTVSLLCAAAAAGATGAGAPPRPAQRLKIEFPTRASSVYVFCVSVSFNLIPLLLLLLFTLAVSICL